MTWPGKILPPVAAHSNITLLLFHRQKWAFVHLTLSVRLQMMMPSLLPMLRKHQRNCKQCESVVSDVDQNIVLFDSV